MTKKLYDDGHLSCFECTVTGVTKFSDRTEITTDESAFFPEGGGQSCDKGTLSGMTVTHVRLDGDDIVHVVGASVNIQIGDRLSGTIDMAKRLSDMQQHSGEHIVSGLAHSMFGCDNVGFRLGSDAVTLDLNIRLDSQQLESLEQKSNEAVRDCRRIRIDYPNTESLKAIDYRSKIEIRGTTRLVCVEGIDICACCAPHVSCTGEIGLIRFVDHENYKGGTRLHILCGERAVEDITKKLKSNSAVGSLLSVRETETAAAVQRLLDEKSILALRLHETEKKLTEAKVSTVSPAERLTFFEDTADTDTLRELAVALKEKCVCFAAVFGMDGDEVTKYVVCCRRGDAREIGKALNLEFNGRGGGKPDMVQGTLNAEADAVSRLLEAFEV